MTWTNKFATVEEIHIGYAYYDDGVAYWMEATDDYFVYSYSDGDAAKVEILDPVNDIPEFTSKSDIGWNPAIALINGALVFVSIVVGTTDTLIAYKYNGTPNSWTRTLSISGSDTVTSINLSLCESKRLIVGWQSSSASCTSCINEYRMTTDGSSWVSINGALMPNDDFDSRSGVGFFDDNHYMHVYDRVNSDYEIWESISGGSFTFLHDLSGDDITYKGYGIKSSGNCGADLFAIRNTDDVVMRSGDGSTWLATSLTITGSPYDVEIAYAGGRAFILNGGNIYYYKSGWQLIESAPNSSMTAAMNYNGKLWVHVNDGGTPASGDAWYEHSTFSDFVDIYPASSTSEKILSLSTPLLGGDTVWTTVWKDGTLYAQKRDTSGAVTSEYSLGSATESQVTAKTYVAYVWAITDDRVIIYGRMDAPQSLSSPVHIIYTTDGGTTWAEQQDGWAADNCGALLTDKTGKLYAVRNQTGGSPILYTGTLGGITMFKKATLPFSVGVNHGNLFLDGDSNLFSAAGDTDTVSVAVCPPPYLQWADITSDHPSVGINRVIRL